MAHYFSSPNRRAWLGMQFLALAVLCALVGWGVREKVLAMQLDLLASQSRQHAEFYRLNLESLLARNSSLPRVIAMEDRLTALLRHPEQDSRRLAANAYLREVRNSAGINSVFLMDKDGRTLAASNYRLSLSYVGNNYAFRPYFQDAMRSGEGAFYGVDTTTGDPSYFLAAAIEDQGRKIGVVAIKISLDDYEMALARSGDKVFLVDEHGVVFLTSVPNLKYSSLTDLDQATLRKIEASRQYYVWQIQPLAKRLYLQDDPQVIRIALPDTPAHDYLVQSARTGTLRWSIVLLSTTRQERQNALLAGVAAAFAVAFVLLVAIYFRLRIRRHHERRQAAAALRQASHELERRIVERTADLQQTNSSLEEKIEAIKTTESILRETRDRAVQAGKLAVLGQMAAGISHEVNQPLTALHTFTDNAVDLLDRGRLDEVRENLGCIRQMAVRMWNIVGENKTFARTPVTERRAVRVAEVLGYALVLLEPRRRKIGAQVDAADVGADLLVWADQQRLEQVLVNLLLNALDAVADSDAKRIRVGALSADGVVRIIVHDSGAGIPEAILPRLFEPFFTTKSSGQGLGLGLAISRLIVAEFGGTIAIRNPDSGGAEFSVILESA